MTLTEYQRAAAEFAEFAPDSIYPFLGLAEEAGAACGKVAKWIRRNGDAGVYRDPVLRERIEKELGDVLWMTAACAAMFRLDLGKVAKSNIAKLSDRKARGVIVGEGDDR